MRQEINTKQIVVKNIYFSNESHTAFKAKDDLHKKLSRANAAPLKQTALYTNYIKN